MLRGWPIHKSAPRQVGCLKLKPPRPGFPLCRALLRFAPCVWCPRDGVVLPRAYSGDASSNQTAVGKGTCSGQVPCVLERESSEGFLAREQYFFVSRINFWSSYKSPYTTPEGHGRWGPNDSKKLKGNIGRYLATIPLTCDWDAVETRCTFMALDQWELVGLLT